MLEKYMSISKPIEAIKFDGTNIDQLKKAGVRVKELHDDILVLKNGDCLKIGDYLIKQIDGTFYSMMAERFEGCYIKVEETKMVNRI